MARLSEVESVSHSGLPAKATAEKAACAVFYTPATEVPHAGDTEVAVGSWMALTSSLHPEM